MLNDNLNLTINGEGLEVVVGGALADIIRGNSSDNILRGLGGNDLLDGNSGDDHLDGGAGNDELDGGSGTDRIFESANTNFTLTNSQLLRSNGEVDQLSSIERADLRGGASSNTFTLTGWTGTGSIHGGDGVTPNVDTLVVAADVDFVLSNGAVQIGAQSISLLGCLFQVRLYLRRS